MSTSLHINTAVYRDLGMHSILFDGRSDGATSIPDLDKAGEVWLKDGVTIVPVTSCTDHAVELVDALGRNNAERIRLHPFVKRCMQGNVTLSELKIFLVQQGKYDTCPH